MKPSPEIRQSILRLNRDVTLAGRLFEEWIARRSRRAAEFDSRLDAIDAQLARLERVVTMDRSPYECSVIPLAAYRI